MYLESLLNSSKCERYKSRVDNIVNSVDLNEFNYGRCMPNDIKIAIKDIKMGKTCGIDGIYGEHFKYASDKIQVLLSLLFNAMVIHGYMPENMMDTIITPLVKDKKGDLTDGDNYRPLAITCKI